MSSTATPPPPATEWEQVEIAGLWVPKSLPMLYQRRAASHPDDVCELRRVGGVWCGSPVRQQAARLERLALGLMELGVAAGDRVALVSDTRPEWGLLDMAILHAGAVTVGIYPTLVADEVAYQLDHAGAAVCVVEDEAQLDKVRAARTRLPGLRHLVVIDPPPGPLGEGELTLDELEQRGQRAPDGRRRFEARWRAVGPADLATIIYTSGTTGPPKGAMLTHGALVWVVHAAARAMPHRPGEEVGVVFLPLAHALQRVASYAGLLTRARGYYAGSIQTLMDDLREVEPTIQVSVPRIWEKLHTRIVDLVGQAPPHRQALFRLAVAVGRRTAPFRQRSRPLPVRWRLPWAVCERVVSGRLKQRLFGRRVRFLTSGAAPIDPAILEFFYALDLLVLEGWGLTETAAPATLNLPGAFRFGSVGRPLPGVEVRVDPEDGELLVRSPGLFRGYYRDPEATAAAFTPDGFFRTGDVGEVDADGFVRITDRKKDLIVLASGKKVPPQKVEGHFKAVPQVANVLVVGDGHSYLVGLFTLDREELRALARARLGEAGAGALDEAALVRHPGLRAAVDDAIRTRNEELSRFEQLKRWELLEDEWTPAGGELTPTLKLKRRELTRRYAGRIDALYAAGR